MLQTEYAELAVQAGFTQAVNVLADPRRRKHTIASEHYKYVTNKQIQEFQRKLQRATLRMIDGLNQRYDTLEFCALDQYDGCPPAEVLQAVVRAKDFEIFDTFEVGYIEQRIERRPDADPIVFGLIHGSDRKYVIAAWGDDVTPEQLGA